MKNFHYYCLCILVLTILMSACQPNTNTISINQEDAGKVIDMHQGDILEISLEGNPTTGYTWDIIELDTDILNLQGEAEYATSSDALGSGGIMTFTFIASGTGSVRLQMVYHRPWEEDTEPLKSFNVTIDIKK